MMDDRIKNDFLHGAKPIADELGLTRRQIYHAADHGLLPIFRMGKTLCAHRSSLREHLARLEAGHLMKAS